MAALAACALLAVAAPCAAAQEGAPPAPEESRTARHADSVTEAMVTRLATELRCPVCQGLSIQDSPSDLALQMKDVIRGQLLEGRTPEEVRQYFVGRYGEWVLMEPRPAGFNLLVYLLPAAMLAGGALVVLVLVRRWTARPSETT